jgi:release factor glutamine methyltransferase
MIVEQILELLQNQFHDNIEIIDIGTGSGCIIIAIAHAIENVAKINEIKYFGLDISKNALIIAKKNSKSHKLNKKIKFTESNLLSTFMHDQKYKALGSNLIITANLPYLSKEIYNSTPIDVKKHEPKSALYSAEDGLQHYRKLLEQLKDATAKLPMLHTTCIMEISPEQKKLLTGIIKGVLPMSKIEFKKDLAGKWRTCKIEIQ